MWIWAFGAFKKCLDELELGIWAFWWGGGRVLGERSGGNSKFDKKEWFYPQIILTFWP